MPNNLEGILGRLSGCPEELEERLRTSWTMFGQKLKDYRDCTQHFAIDTAFGSCYVTMKQLEDGVCRAWARIPDNPKTKSRKMFSYDAGHDALTYGWEIVNEVTSVAADTVAATRVL